MNKILTAVVFSLFFLTNNIAISQTHISNIFNGPAFSVSDLGDINNDGISDFIVGESISEQAEIFSGFNLQNLYTVSDQSFTAPAFGTRVAALSDINNDGAREFIVFAPGNISPYSAVYSGTDGTLLATYPQPGNQQSDGASAASIGDVDGDGNEDFVEGIKFFDPSNMGNDYGRVRVLSITGSIIFTYTGPLGSMAGGNVVSIDGDSAPHRFAFTQGATIQIYQSLSANSISFLRQINLLYSGTRQVEAIDDLDNDGINDLAVLYTNSLLNIYSSGSGQLISSFSPLSLFPSAPFAYINRLEKITDFDNDGKSDLFVIWNGTYPNSAFAVISSATGALINATFQSPGDRIYDGFPVGDLNLDGNLEVLLTIEHPASFSSEMQLFSITTLPAASNLNIGSSCGPIAPQLSLSAAVKLDQGMVTANISGAPANKVGALFIGATAIVNGFVLPNMCNAYFSPINIANGTFTQIDFFTSASGTASIPIAYPNIPLFSGLPLILQVAVLDPSAPGGYSLSAGMLAQLGY